LLSIEHCQRVIVGSPADVIRTSARVDEVVFRARFHGVVAAVMATSTSPLIPSMSRKTA